MPTRKRSTAPRPKRPSARVRKQQALIAVLRREHRLHAAVTRGARRLAREIARNELSLLDLLTIIHTRLGKKPGPDEPIGVSHG